MLGRPHHALVVEQRLAHAHEDDAAHRMRRVGADLHHLIDDLPRRQVAAKAHAARGAEDAAHRAADLRADADDVLLVLRADAAAECAPPRTAPAARRERDTWRSRPRARPTFSTSVSRGMGRSRALPQEGLRHFGHGVGTSSPPRGDGRLEPARRGSTPSGASRASRSCAVPSFIRIGSAIGRSSKQHLG